jgi:hypothetical protein
MERLRFGGDLFHCSDAQTITGTTQILPVSQRFPTCFPTDRVVGS